MATLDKTISVETTWSRLRRAALWLLFAGLLLIPKVLGFRRRALIWNAARLVTAILGAGLLLAAWEGTRHALAAAVFGALLFVLSLAIPPERLSAAAASPPGGSRGASPGEQTDALARRLGAAIVLRGGTYRVGGAAVETRFFVGSENVWILNPSFAILFIVPVAKLALLRAEPADGGWKLSLAWDSEAADFHHQGPFAEHFARVAESTLRSQMPGKLPILP